MTDYTKFYGFSENPFDISPDPKFFFPSENHREALASLRYGITHRKGFILILGEAGIGKTMLIQHLISTLDAQVKIILFPQSRIPFEQMLKEMLITLKLPLGLETKGSMIHKLYDYLIGCLAREETVAVIIDEAENIGLKVIEEVRLLANLETSTSKLLQIILVGQPELREKLRSEVIRQIKQRIVITCEIKPLTEKESLRYIAHRLQIAGSAASAVFTDEALSLICRYSKGIPLALNTMCNDALTVGCGLSEQRISASTVKKVRRARGILTAKTTRILAPGIKRRLPKIFFIIPALVLVAMALFFGGSYVQPIFNGQKPSHSVMPPILRDNTSAPEVKRHDAAENVPGRPGSEMMDAVAVTPTMPVSLPAVKSHADAEIRIKEIVEVKQGVNLYSLAYRYYKASDETLIDHILKLNPEITNPNLILISQKIKIPEITGSLLIVQYSEGLYKVHLKTFANLKSAGQYKRDVGLMGQEIEIIAWKVSPGATWYRVMAGPFGDREKASRALEEMQRQGLSIVPS